MKVGEENKNELIEKNKKDDPRLEYNVNHHMNELMKEILAYYKEDGYDRFEEISMYIKKRLTKISFQYKLPKNEPKKLIEITDYEEKILKDLGKKKPKILPVQENYIEDILSLSRILEWAGISFGKNTWFKIRYAMNKLAKESDALNIKFWGKIYGRDSDYFVLMGTLKNYGNTNAPAQLELRGNEGVNKYTFWVSNSILEDWYELPDITSEQITASRFFKYHFTGDLNAKVKGFNNFPGRESHLLKCQIIRITHSSFIVPEGYLRINSKFEGDLQDKVTEFNDEFQMPPIEDLKSEEKWVHEFSYIFPNGRIIDLAQENQIPRMQPISSDDGYKDSTKEGAEDIKYWKFRTIGDQMQYTLPGGAGMTTYSVLLIKNNRWIGHSAVLKNGEFINVYIGHGIKTGGNVFIPSEPGDIENDPEGQDEHNEPNPDKEVENIEVDTDKEEEKNEDQDDE